MRGGGTTEESRAMQQRPSGGFNSPVVGVRVAGGGAQLGQAVLHQGCCRSNTVVAAAVVWHADAARLPTLGKRHLLVASEASLRKRERCR